MHLFEQRLCWIRIPHNPSGTARRPPFRQMRRPKPMRQARTMKLALVDQLRPPIVITNIPKITRCLNPERAHLRNVPKLGNATPERSAVAKRNSGTFRRHRTPFCGSATPFCGRQRFYGTFRSCETQLRNVPLLGSPTPGKIILM